MYTFTPEQKISWGKCISSNNSKTNEQIMQNSILSSLHENAISKWSSIWLSKRFQMITKVKPPGPLIVKVGLRNMLVGQHGCYRDAPRVWFVIACFVGYRDHIYTITPFMQLLNLTLIYLFMLIL